MDNRIPFIAGNWKMFKTVSEAIETSEKLVNLLSTTIGKDVMIAPPFTALYSVADIIRESCIALGAQNLFWEKEGAYTGEISSPMLRSVGCKYVIIGHSERRQYFGDNDNTVNKKVRAALEVGLIPILCVGESEKERKSGHTFSILDKQLKKGLKSSFLDNLETIIIAYEPLWAIGTGKTATKEQAQEVHSFLRSLIEKEFGNRLSDSIRILYGGSVNPDNISELMGMPDIDGALVGGASLNPDIFSKIVTYTI